MSQMNLTESRIDIADWHTTLYHFADSPLPHSTMLGNRSGYEGLYRFLHNQNGTTYPAPEIISAMRVFYRPVKFWKAYLNSTYVYSWPSLAWVMALPVLALLSPRVTHTEVCSGIKVALQPSILLYPFGWSTWLSVRITGTHSISELAAIATNLQFVQVLNLAAADGTSSILNLKDFFDQIAAGVRDEVFGGPKTLEFSPQEFVRMVTVISKNGGSLSLHGLGVQDERDVRSLLRPKGVPLQGSLDDMSHALRTDNGVVNYILCDRFSRFLWFDDLLVPVGQNRQHLDCYHQNSVISLIQACHLDALLTQTDGKKGLSQDLTDLLQMARNTLQAPPFINASLHHFLKHHCKHAKPAQAR
jgi:hypothetical protein